MKKFFYILIGLIGLLGIAYLCGPKPANPSSETPTITLPNSFTDLENEINESEQQIKGLKPNNEARIVWLDSSKKEKTPISMLYLHGFSASQEEGSPVHTNLAKQFGCNLYLARLAGHGIDLGDSTMIDLTTDDYIHSAEKALAVAQKLGKEVIIVGTSAGGALTLLLAARHPDIKAIVLYSPCVKIYDSNAELLDNPWGKQLAQQIKGSDFNDITPKNELQPKYWTMHYRLNGLVALQNMLTNFMTAETFAKVKCPTMLCYYYKNEEEQDKVVSVAAMKEMFEQISTPKNQKHTINFPKANNHVLASHVLSEDWENVETETVKFLKEVVKIK